MMLNDKQIQVKSDIEKMAEIFGIDPNWAVAVALTESSLGLNQMSPTGCRGVFQISSIAMQDLWLLMGQYDDELVDIVCGIAFLRLLLRRWGSINTATAHYCAPLDRNLYIDRVRNYMKELLGIQVKEG